MSSSHLLPRPSPDRAVTIPDLASTLERLSSHPREDFRSIAARRKQSEGTISQDGLNDLGTRHDSIQHSNSSYKSAAAGSSTSSLWVPERFYRPFSSPRLPSRSAWQTYFMQEVAGDVYLETQLLAMTIATGALDAMTFTTYSVFTSKQTGNTLFLALYAFRIPSLDRGIERNVITSMLTFITGAIFFGHIGHLTRQRRRIWLLISNLFQALLMLAAAAIRFWTHRSRTDLDALGIIALLAFAESGQIANALNVSKPELNTTMITGALIQLCTDKKIFKLHNAKRNRRLAFFCSMLVGCFTGAALLETTSSSAVLVVVAGIKGGLVISFFFNKGLIEKKRMLEDGREKVEGTVTPASRVLWGD